MVDFTVGKVGETFILAAQSDAAKKLCRKHGGNIQTIDDGVLVFPPGTEVSGFGWHIVKDGLSLEDMSPEQAESFSKKQECGA